MRSLEETIREAEAVFRRQWANEGAAVAEKLETPEGARIKEALEIMRQRLPPFVNEHTSKLRARAKPELLAAVDAWQWGSHTLVLCGPTRCGKTSAAAALVRRLMARAAKAGGDEWARAKWIRWEHAASLANARKRHGLGEDEAPVVEQAMRAPLLVLDDLGWDVDPAVIGEVLNARYENKKPTIVTTGLNAKQLLERYGDAVYRRIFEAGGKGYSLSLFPKETP